MLPRPFSPFRVFTAILALIGAVTGAVAEGPTLKPSTTTQGMRGQQIVLNGENLPATIDKIIVKVGSVFATVSEATADSLTFQLPIDAPLGQQSLIVTFPMGEKM